ncbi:hypothetical protein ILUMI_03814 [Ignelater luminosus]|uniref:CRAL-TRIO domain-containing protein n=1 Tax=Ignelater luminosus TaxID=2038154 RepID=A0A8K0GLT1_IGNLU|nr:hypothetical protein ILUMI_03814 [Ignelater luminosus]
MEECQKEFDIEGEYRKNVNLKREDVQLVRKWMQNQSKYPEVSDHQLFLFLHSNYYDIENTKSTIDAYFTQRANWPQVFRNRNPNLPSAKLHTNVCVQYPLKQQTKEGYRVIYAKAVDCIPANFNFEQQLKLFFSIFELWLTKVPDSEGFIVILDALGMTWGHLPKFGISHARKLVAYVQDAFPIRLKGIHVININPIIEKVIQLIRMFMKKELSDMTLAHSTFETFYKYLPKEALPKDYGGDNATILELHKSMMETLEKNAAFFEDDDDEEEQKPKQKGRFSFLSSIY